MSLLETMLSTIFWYLGAFSLCLLGAFFAILLSFIYVIACSISLPMTIGIVLIKYYGFDFVTAFGISILSLYPSYKLNDFIFYLATDYNFIIKRIKIRFKAKYKKGSIVKDANHVYEILDYYDIRHDGICYHCLKLTGIKTNNPYGNQFILAEDDIVKDYGKLSKKMIKILFKDV